MSAEIEALVKKAAKLTPAERMLSQAGSQTSKVTKRTPTKGKGKGKAKAKNEL